MNNISAAARQGTAGAVPLHRNFAEVEVAQAAALQHPSARCSIILRLRFLGERLEDVTRDKAGGSTQRNMDVFHMSCNRV